MTVSPLLGQTLPELTTWVAAQGQPTYRAKQLHQWLYQRGVRQFQDITVFPKSWREQVQPELGRSIIAQRLVAQDGTVKYLLQLQDGNLIETVGIPSADRLTVCVSSQVGCPMACDFCATGKQGFTRNLAVHEILDQVLTVQTDMARRVSHLVFMGMGEPLLNLEPVIAAVQRLNQDCGISQRAMTISTVGVPHQIERLAQAQLQTTLAVSLHAPTQELRQRLIPSGRHYPLEQLLQDCRDYVARTKRRLSFEYTLLAGVNDTPELAHTLAKLLRGWQSHLNLIPYNPIQDAPYERPRTEQIQAFQKICESYHLEITVRRTRGLSAQAACGQLRSLAAKLVSSPAQQD
ncbi:radical SAM enzyme, Cfr family [Gloeomargarita lithophora Alchichica-D10]|uniref:Probable dual-specificity RNA methyltransferase RlmN n=1 Tax=Gloeomargarita lithophora Alchichica-D10 TaxID=1188229 RepID=A0A1J0A9C3_9CYAN|nr:23S rRNA (adenine(2503)-C(2))-methyltransferase RlmN [Gloeomargarita lithophora]APB32531.1 radical SAM enzyme, Cfr family [Gloeomargarita lithophora Alchichica-D10]